MTSWLGFWAFLSVLLICDCWIFSQGYDSFLQTHKTKAEKQIQQIKINKLREKSA